MVISVDPDPDILELPTGIDSTWESSEDLYIIIFPLSTSTASLNVKTILSFTNLQITHKLNQFQLVILKYQDQDLPQ